MIKSVLIANRGEIACRVIKTAHRLGIQTVAVYSDIDAEALHVKQADKAIHIGPAPAAQSYLVGEKLIEAAKTSSVEAIHPGYGFLSENADFAQAVISAGLVWVGPPPRAIRDMGLKDAAKSLMMAANVPTTPGYLGEDQSPKVLKSEADKIGYPVLIKAVAGGGGKGMRHVDKAANFKEALNSCRREAKASFGDDRVLLEKWIADPRHIEVQVFGDDHGNVVHLFERDCTLQRRHQKVIEEAPAPGMNATTREAVCAAAVRAAEAVNYTGAGTVEFIADGSGELDENKIWFMEMNTRLQVEHPVTELITGVDLVEWQFLVASGEPIPRKQEELSITGWAMEARLYAENPSTGFLPSTGHLDVLSLPEHIRVDTGVQAQGDVSAFYDPMIAKLISYGANREDARIKLANACDQVATYPVQNNAGFVAGLLREDTFEQARVTTGFIGNNLDHLTQRPEPTLEGLGSAAAHLAERVSLKDHSGSAGHRSIWSNLSGFRLSAPLEMRTTIDVDGKSQEIELVRDIEGKHLIFDAGDNVLLIEQGWTYVISSPTHYREDEKMADDGEVRSPMPGRIVSIEVSVGDAVAEGQNLATLEAMKMELTLTSPINGYVTALHAGIDQHVSEGMEILSISSESDI